MTTTLYYKCDVGKCTKRYVRWGEFDKHLQKKHNKKHNNKDDYIQIGIQTLVKPKPKPPKPVLLESESVIVHSLCSCCYEHECDTTVVPCGHLAFCYSCIEAYHIDYPNKGCPICDSEIIMITKIYMNVNK